MNAAQLVAVLREAHEAYGWDGSCGDPEHCYQQSEEDRNECRACGEQMPCSSVIAADRIEVAMKVQTTFYSEYGQQAMCGALNGDGE